MYITRKRLKWLEHQRFDLKIRKEMQTITLAGRQKQQFGKARILHKVPRHRHSASGNFWSKILQTLLKRAANFSLWEGKVAKEYWLALTQVVMRSRCGSSGSIVVELRHQPTPLYTSGHSYSQFIITLKTYLLRQLGGVCQPTTLTDQTQRPKSPSG